MSSILRGEWAIRAITGTVFVAVVMGAVYLSAWSNAVLWCVVSILAWLEWHRAPSLSKPTWQWWLAGMFPLPAVCSLIWLGFQSPDDPWPILVFLWMIWANDTGAYVVGKPFGRHKLWVSVSPGKSWEGTFGGALAAGSVSAIAWGPNMLWLGLLMGGLSTSGDLIQSAWKRKRGMKDSGTMLPGHGGIMDRFDGFLLSAPIYALLWCIFVA